MLRSGTLIVTIATALLLNVLAPSVAHANWIAGLSTNHPSPSWLPYGESVVVNIDYKINEAEGALIHVTPFAGGVEVSDVTLGASPLVSQGQGTVTRSFAVHAGPQTIDEVRVRMNNPANTLVLLEFFLPVEFVYGPYGIFDLQFNKTDYSVLARDEALTVDFTIGAPEGESVLVWARPYFEGSPVLGYSSNGARPGGNGDSGFSNFWFGTEAKDVDGIHFKMVSADQSVTLLEFDIPGHYFWRQIGVSNFQFSIPSSPSAHSSHFVTATFDYLSNAPGGSDALYTIQPYYDGSYATNGWHQTRAVVRSGAGSSSRNFGATGDASVNQLRLLVTNPDETYAYVDVLIPVQYEFSGNSVYNLTTIPTPPMQIDYTEVLTVNFDYKKDDPGTVLIIALPAVNETPVVPLYSSGSWPYSAAEGSETYSYQLTENSSYQDINQLHVKMFLQNSTNVLDEYYMDFINHWGPSGIATSAPATSRLRSSLEQNVPNPFNPQTSIVFNVAGDTHATLRVYDASGRLVKTLLHNEEVHEGKHSVNWDGRDESGRTVATGVYFYQLETNSARKTKRMLLVK